MPFLINTSNLHVGGGVQVAASFLSEISRTGQPVPGLAIALSTQVRGNLGPEVQLARVSDTVVDLDVRGFGARNARARRFMDGFDTVFTVFGPLYRWRPRFKSIVGFAQPWIIYPGNECYAAMPLLRRLRTRLKFRVQAQFFKRADVLVVELDHVKAGLVRELGIDPSRIHVVRNCVSGIYRDSRQWQPVAIPPAPGLRLGFVGRNYPHKNTAIFPRIVAALRERHGIDAVVYVTFTPAEWQACSAEFRAACINVGPLTPAQCPGFYGALDAVVFPSLLECFSATPLEAMAMEKPLFASDRPFNRDICSGHAVYFDPHSADDAADAIARMPGDGGPDPAALRAARDHAFSFSSPAERAQKYLALLAQGDDHPSDK